MHPSIKILLFLVCVVAINLLSPRLLLVVATLITLTALILSARSFAKLLSRMLVFFLSIIIIYAFLTPGEYVQTRWLSNQTMLTYEGVIAGGLQTLRLVVVIALMNILLHKTHHIRLLYGLSILLRPLKLFKLPTEQMIARIHLTIYYAEQLLSQPSSLSLDLFNSHLKNSATVALPVLQDSYLDLNDVKQSLTCIDYVVILCIFLLIITVILYGIT